MTSAWLHNGYVVYSYYRIHRVSSPVILQHLPSYYRLEFCLSEVHWGSHLSRGLRALELVRSRGCSSVGWCCSTGVGSAGVSGSAGSGVFGFLVLRLSIFECVLFLILLRCVLFWTFLWEAVHTALVPTNCNAIIGDQLKQTTCDLTLDVCFCFSVWHPYSVSRL